ncbi:unnamed protein product, partial [Rotaria sp. Silwood1]
MATTYVQESQKREDKAKARFLFNDLDTDSSGYIDAIELQKLLIQWGLPENEVDAYLAEDDDKRFSFEEFYQNLKPIWNFAYEHMKLTESAVYSLLVTANSNVTSFDDNKIHAKKSNDVLGKVALVANQTTSQLIEDSMWP